MSHTRVTLVANVVDLEADADDVGVDEERGERV